jgi:molecular chaperone GrpE
MNDPKNAGEDVTGEDPNDDSNVLTEDAEPQTPESESAQELSTGEVIEGTEDELVADEAMTLADEVQLLHGKLAEREDALLRLKAESDNARKRSARDVDNARKFALEKFINELLPVRDSMELGVAACDSDGATLASVREGLEMTDKMFLSAVEKFGVVLVDPTGDAFNPDLHQAISMQPTPGVDAGQVVMVVQKGYTLNDRLVRPAMVIVSQ